MLIGLFLLVVGAVFGSFFHVVVFRSLDGKPWLTERSECDSCGRKLQWYDLFPLVSYLWLGGRCRYCESRISPTHWWFEFAFGTWFVWWGLVGFSYFTYTSGMFSWIQPIFWLLVGMLLIALFMVDGVTLLIPDWILWGLGGVAVIYRSTAALLGWETWSYLGWTTLGAVIVTLIFWVLHAGTRGRGMGSGDVLLVGPLAMLLGWERLPAAMLLAFVLGSVFGVGLLLAGRHHRQQPLPFGPFLVAGTFISLVWGADLLEWWLTFGL